MSATIGTGVGDVLDLADVPVPDREVMLEEMVSAAHAMSVRSVYRVFEEAGETVGGFVRGAAAGTSLP